MPETQTDMPQASPLAALQKALQDGSLRAAVQRRKHGDALSVATDALESHGDTATRVEALAGIAHLIVAELEPQRRLDLLRKLDRMRLLGVALAEEVTTDTLSDARRTLRDVNDLTEDAEATLKDGWQRCVSREFTNIAELGTVLDQLGAEVELGNSMRVLATEGLVLAEPFPPSSDNLTSFDEKRAEKGRLLIQLAESGGGLTTFLRRIAAGEATLADLDDETLRWLRDQGALARFSVHLASGS